jgi:hypothetical protein
MLAITMSIAPYFDAAEQCVRFWVPVGERLLGASISSQALHYTYRAGAHGEDPLETFLAYQPAIEHAVRCRVAQGAREPVMLREFHMKAENQGTA